jgi:Pin2-interacting protein X1
LEVLSGLLGRLNGKSDDQLEKEMANRRDVKLMRYQNEKHGMVGFVFGGYLVGDEIKSTMEKELTSEKEDLNLRLRDDGEILGQEARDGTDHSAVLSIHNKLEAKITAAGDLISERRKKKEKKRGRREARRMERGRQELRNAQPTVESEPHSEPQYIADNGITDPGVDQLATSTPLPAQRRGRHLIRQKYIQQKRMACMNEKALNEVSARYFAQFQYTEAD